MSVLREMVDLVVDRAEMEHPHVGYSIWLSPANARAFAAHVRDATYRTHEVVESALVGDDVVRLDPVLDGGTRAARACSYAADLAEEIISVYGPVLDATATTSPDAGRALSA